MQQINLYLPEFQPNREPLRSIHMLWGLVAFVLVLALVTMTSVNSNREREVALQQQRIELEQLKTQMAQLEQQRPRVNLAELDEQILLLTQKLDSKKQIFNIISSKSLGNNSGFSQHLQALGRQSLTTVSLSAFSLQFGGNYTEFAGQAHAADQIPLYIQRLRSEPVFAQSAFGVLNLQPMSSGSGVFNFSVARQAVTTGSEPQGKTAVQTLLERNAQVGGEQ